MVWGRGTSLSFWRVVACLGAAWLVASGGQAMGADWRLFGVEDFGGYLALKSETYSEQVGDGATTRQTLEELARLRLSSYVFHPRFLSLTADTTLTVKNGVPGDSGLRDYSLAVDVLRENMLSAGAATRAKVEDLEGKDFDHYERETQGTAAQIALRGAALSATAKVEDSSVKSNGDLEETKENKHNRVLLLDSSFRANEVTSTAFRAQDVTSDDLRTPANSNWHRSLDLVSSRSLSSDRGTLNLTASSWQSEFPQAARPSTEKRLTLREQWLMTWSKTLQSFEEAEYTRRDQDGVGYDNYRALVNATKSLGQAWRVGGQLSSSRNQSTTGEETAIHRLSGTAGYLSQWGAYAVGFNETLGLTETSAGAGRVIRVWDEPHQLPVNGSTQALGYPNVQLSSIVIKDKLTHAVWNDYCTITQSGSLTYIGWKDPSVVPPGFEGQTAIDVEVDYVYEPPGGGTTTSYQEVSNILQARAARELAAGVNLDASALLNTRTLPQGKTDNRYEASLQATVKREEAEGAAGAALATERNTLFARGALTRFGWKFSEAYQAEFFPTSTGHRFETRANRLWGLASKTNISLELSDQTYLFNGQLLQGLVGGRVKATRLFNPFMRVEVEGRAESNRVLPGDLKLSLDAKYLWRQGRLDLTAGYELTKRTYDRFLSHRLYVTLIRAL